MPKEEKRYLRSKPKRVIPPELQGLKKAPKKGTWVKMVRRVGHGFRSWAPGQVFKYDPAEHGVLSP